MKTVKLILVIPLVICVTNLFSQIPGFREDNILLPDKLIFSEHVGFDSLYQNSVDSFYFGKNFRPFFEIDKKNDFVKMIVKKAMNSEIEVFDVNNYNASFPYSALESNDRLTANALSKLLGLDTFKVYDDQSMSDKLMIKAIDLSDLKSVNFVEEWVLTGNPLSFKKHVYAIEPVRRSKAFDDDDLFRFRKMFRYYNKQANEANLSNLKLVATIKYEHFFNLDGLYSGCDFRQLINGYFSRNEAEYNQYIYNEYSPFFNIFNQQILVKTLLDNVFSGKVKATDFGGSNVLTPDETRSQVFETLIVNIENPETGQLEERKVESDRSSEILSLIFKEEWYFNEETLAFQKIVKSVAPVRYYLTMEGEQDAVKRKILFEINLN